jgi:formamidopyrimidine-DNA glycosylase
MPELPEVETVARGLRARIDGRVVTAVTTHRKGLRFPFPANMAKNIAGQKITAIERFAKYILIRLKNGGAILLHLGMSGRLFYEPVKNFKPGKHDHVVFHFDKGPLLVFNDARRFGVMDYIPPEKTTLRQQGGRADHNEHKLLKHLGIDPLSDDLTSKFLFDKISKRKTSFKAILMDQKMINGLGNIYVCEALFRAKIHPKRLGISITKAEAGKLAIAIKAVLKEAIEAGGSSLRDYVQPDGELGFFQDRFRVYGREDKPCKNCKTPIERFTQNGRSTFACPQCQKQGKTPENLHKTL